jgi:hypothetical protein
MRIPKDDKNKIADSLSADVDVILNPTQCGLSGGGLRLILPVLRPRRGREEL